MFVCIILLVYSNEIVIITVALRLLDVKYMYLYISTLSTKQDILIGIVNNKYTFYIYMRLYLLHLLAIVHIYCNIEIFNYYCLIGLFTRNIYLRNYKTITKQESGFYGD